MSKYVKNLLCEDFKGKLAGVENALLVSIAGLDANKTHRIRMELRKKDMRMMLVRNRLARRATDGTALAPAFANLNGPAAIVWGGADIVMVAKEIVRLAGDKELAPFAPRGGVLDGATLTADQVTEVSKWPSREEQLALLVGQILAPGAKLASQLTAMGGALASQIESKTKSEGEPEAAAAAE
jgi:ribosomal protein L10